ncbi:hypothetical protein H5P36_25700 [Bacillus sp. APMAM]|nr:hypothetical protein [Bacillus sp. APMAM]RTZ53044.1 hypothetical protein EKO25_25550 [Bacillus sp. SAJ1]
MINGLEFASVKDLEKEVEEQVIFLRFIPNTFQLEEDSPLSDYVGKGGNDFFVVCKEGVFAFEDDKYEFVGKFSKDNLKRVRRLHITNHIFVNYDSDIQLIMPGNYEILNTGEIELENGVKHKIFEIEIDVHNTYTSEKKIKVKVPDNPGVFSIDEYDFLAIDYTEEYLNLLGLL